jgi:SAM-dependent methyltransferase
LVLFVPTAISLIASFYIYDLSGLYALAWIEPGVPGTVVNIHAGFDETSAQLTRKFPLARLLVFDFYDPAKHTEVSVKRARRAYPPFPDTMRIETTVIPLKDGVADRVFVTFSAHEIRNGEERTGFFKQLNRILRPGGYIQVTEHFRDLPNFLVYNIGVLHFLSRKSCLSDFAAAGLRIRNEKKLNPFITTFILEKHDPLS